MKKALKYTLATLAVAAIAAPAFAGVMEQVSVKAAALYTEPSNNGLNVGFYTLAPAAAASNSWRPEFLQPEFSWDYSLGVAYRMPQTNARFVVEYEHYNQGTSRVLPGVSQFNQALNVSTVSNIARVTQTERDFRFGVTQTVDFGNKYEMTFGGYFEYDKLQQTLNELYTSTAAGVTTASARTIFNEMEGWGPTVDALGRAYPWGHDGCWSFWVRGGFGLLDGDNQFTMTGVSGSTSAPIVNGNLTPESTWALISKINADFGIEYNRVMRADFSDMTLGIRLGMKYVNYLNAFKNGNLQQFTDVVGTATIPATYNTSSVDFSRLGPFLEFKIGGGNS